MRTIIYQKMKKVVCLSLLIILAGGSALSAAQDPSLVARWRLDEGSGTTVRDSIRGNDGTLHGDALWTAGIDWGGVYLDGIDDYIEIPNVLTKSMTMAFWFKPDWDGTDTGDYRLFDASVEGLYFFIAKGAYNSTTFNTEDLGLYFQDDTDYIYENFEFGTRGLIFADTWFHFAVTWEFGGGTAAMYFNGTLAAKSSALSDFPVLNNKPRFGLEVIDYVASQNGAMGVIDNIYIFNRALSAAEIQSLMATEVERATEPIPNDEEPDVFRDVILSWTPGIIADTHNVYFGDNFDDINNADSGSPLLVGPGLDAASYYPGRLEMGKTYYWRVDEINAPPDNTVFRGNVWSFTVEPDLYPVTSKNIIATASSYKQGQGPEKTIDSSGLTGETHLTNTSDMWLSEACDPGSAWIMYDLNKDYQLHEMRVWNYNGKSYLSYFGLKDVIVEHSTDGTNWTQMNNVTEFAMATGKDGYAYNTTVPFDDITARYVKIYAQTNWGGGGLFNSYGLSEVQLMVIPLYARNPDPEDGTIDVAIDTTLDWRIGRKADVHNVYISTDQAAVKNGTAPVVTLDQVSYNPPTLELGSTYFWRVDEVNNVETPSIWEGDLWSFTTQEYLVVDDFESYNEIAEGQEGSNLVYLTWVDGYSNPTTNGSTMGYITGNSLELLTVHGGGKSAPLMYDNRTASYSKVTASTDNLQIGRNWTVGSPEMFSLWYYGDAENAAEQMYIELNGTKRTVSVDPTRASWQELEVTLADFGINLGNVTTVTIGLERTGSTGGSGTLLIDDIRLSSASEQ